MSVGNKVVQTFGCFSLRKLCIKSGGTRPSFTVRNEKRKIQDHFPFLAFLVSYQVQSGEIVNDKHHLFRLVC